MNHIFPRSAGQRVAAMAVEGRRQDAARMLSMGMAFLQAARDAGARSNFLSDAARGLYDELGDLIGTMERDLDNEHLVSDGAQVDRSELLALIESIDSPLAMAAE